ncbi:MAG: exodeoxyribonuclease VII small subunit [candidate division KSB1 bacterium]|nr:exodeoxyribonuclease VII small subunit [candidate division KSB1 bacterium]MDZ7333910.1 exodeoxyribonuclease VII small subunit [candidate division KSB1 bacterium]MDZ7358289.1 exodeoxyribonuclease VII small subunit [candidate division KSB1 bacterium]MDZ7399156.1 exodeoxyribonuclease VII small subunit [candidate division KSB1 bacterium]
MAVKSFEQAMEQLEQIVDQMEQGDLTLEETLAKFEEGMKLSQFCLEKLNQAEQKLKKLVKTEGGFQLEAI